MYQKSILYHTGWGNYDAYLDEEWIGAFPNYLEAEKALDALILELVVTSRVTARRAVREAEEATR